MDKADTGSDGSTTDPTGDFVPSSNSLSGSSSSPTVESVTSIFGIGTELLRLRGGGQGALDTSPLVMPFSLK